jgi:LysM repeat protein
MTQRTSQSARALAVSALLVGFIVIVVAIATALSGNSTGGSSQPQRAHLSRRAGEGQHKAPAAYVVQSGDTLISIAHKTGVPVAEIERLNPEVDPQILVSGEKLKLR